MIKILRMIKEQIYWRLLALALIIVFVAPFIIPVISASASTGVNLFYTVTIDSTKSTFHVHIELSNLNTGEINFSLPYDRVTNIDQYITNVQARSETGDLGITHIGNHSWDVNQSGGTLFIDYDVSKLMPFGSPSSQDTGQTSIAVYMDENGGLFFGQYVFLTPGNLERNIADIKIKFSLPEDWQIITPFIERDGYLDVPKITNFYLSDFIMRTIYFGKMRFYEESQGENFKVKFGILENDQNGDIISGDLSSITGVKFYTDRVVLAVDALTKLFGENPFPIIPAVDSFAVSAGYNYQPGVFGEIQYQPAGRFDETIGHLFFLWMRQINYSPSAANILIQKGIGESYYGNKLANEITGDKRYLGKIYYHYLVYKGAQGTQYAARDEIHDTYYRGCIIGLWLDHLIQIETNGKQSLDDVMRYLYRKYKNTEHEINNSDLEAAIDSITNKDHSVEYSKYLDGDQDIPVQDFIQPYKEDFKDFLQGLKPRDWYKDYHGYTIPFFIDVEMAIRSPTHIPIGILIQSNYQKFAEYVINNYDVDKLTEKDVEDSLKALTGQDSSGFFERWKDSYGELSLDEMKSWLNSYRPDAPQINNASYQRDGSIYLTWTDSYNNNDIQGYEIYRGNSSGEETLIGTIPPYTKSYTDHDITSNGTYYYYVKLIGNIFGEKPVSSDKSNEVVISAVEPTETPGPIQTMVSTQTTQPTEILMSNTPSSLSQAVQGQSSSPWIWVLLGLGLGGGGVLSFIFLKRRKDK